ncbi:M50 family metallopeptidase [Pararhodobacter oceanensis]|uniref:M50 family metallopeptidase n=1 Tax=Pararhodobacter oceanensis TaxID=2172121 RepID=UPI003A8D5A2C
MQMIKSHWQLILLTALVFLLWDTPAVFPLKLLVVFLHELSHGGAAIATGGTIERISVSAQQGGMALTRDGNGFLILSAGYLGSLFLGMALLWVALRTRWDRVVVMGFGFLTLLVALLYVREAFALLFCGVVGFGMLAIGRYLSIEINDMVLRLIGLTSVLYVPYDIFDDTIRRSGERSDAYMLAAQYGGPTVLWGALWLLLSLAVIYWGLRRGIGRNSNLSFRRIRRR